MEELTQLASAFTHALLERHNIPIDMYPTCFKLVHEAFCSGGLWDKFRKAYPKTDYPIFIDPSKQASLIFLQSTKWPPNPRDQN